MARRSLRLAVLVLVLVLVAVVGVGAAGTNRHVEARSHLGRSVVITRARFAASPPSAVPAPAAPVPAPAMSAALRRQLALLVRGASRPGAGPRRVVHAPTVTVPSVPSLSCPVAGPDCSLHPCVLFAGAAPVVLRLTTVVRRSRLKPARGGTRPRTVVVPAPFGRTRGGRRVRAAGCRRARALPIS